MSDEVPAKEFNIPYSMTVESETAIRQKSDFWRLRTLSTVLRQTPAQIKSFEERYETPLN